MSTDRTDEDDEDATPGRRLIEAARALGRDEDEAWFEGTARRRGATAPRPAEAGRTVGVPRPSNKYSRRTATRRRLTGGALPEASASSHPTAAACVRTPCS